MLLGVLAVLDGEFGAAMQASKAKGAAFLYPNGLFVLKFDSLDGAFLGAESAADAMV